MTFLTFSTIFLRIAIIIIINYANPNKYNLNNATENILLHEFINELQLIDLREFTFIIYVTRLDVRDHFNVNR